MKTLFIPVITLILSINPTSFQDEITLDVTYDGYYNGLFSFTRIAADDAENGDTIAFEDIASDLLSKYDLKSHKFHGEEFTITYIEEAIEDEDEVLTTYLLTDIARIERE